LNKLEENSFLISLAYVDKLVNNTETHPTTRYKSIQPNNIDIDSWDKTYRRKQFFWKWLKNYSQGITLKYTLYLLVFYLNKLFILIILVGLFTLFVSFAILRLKACNIKKECILNANQVGS
jgi:hypothetical protein